MIRFLSFLLIIIGSAFVSPLGVFANPTADNPLETLATTKEVKVFGTIYPMRFNSAQGDEARYHLLVWNGGTSPGALIETPADDLAFHEALRSLGAQPGDNLTMASWNKRHDPNHSAPKEKVEGHVLEVRLSWEGNSSGIPINQAFHLSGLATVNSELRTLDADPQSPIPNPLSCGVLAAIVTDCSIRFRLLPARGVSCVSIAVRAAR